MEVILIGEGGHARAVRDMAGALGHKVIATAPPNGGPGDERREGGSHLVDLVERTGVMDLLLAIPDVGLRMHEVQRLKSLVPKARFVSLVDPTAYIGSDVTIGAGTLVMPKACIEAGTTIGEHVLIGQRAGVGAECSLGSFANVGAGGSIGFGCFVGSGSAIGTHAAVVARMIVGTHCYVHPGAVVMDHVPDLHVAIGNPAKCVRTRLAGEPHH